MPEEILDTNQTVGAYKSLSRVERAFRSLKSVDLKIRPIHHRLADRVKDHVFLCMLTYYVEWHMRQALAPILFDDHDAEDAARQRPNMVSPAQRSAAARGKARSKVTDDGLPVPSSRTLLDDLATLARNTVQAKSANQDPVAFDKLTQCTPVQQHTLICSVSNP